MGFQKPASSDLLTAVVWSTYVQDGKLCEHELQFIVDGLLSELDFAHVKLSERGDVVALVNDRGSLTLRAGQHDIHKCLRIRDGRDLLEVIVDHVA